MILNDAIVKYEKYLKVTRAKGTVLYFQGKKGIIKQYLGFVECKNINEDILLDFIIQQKERNVDIKNITINKYIATIRQVLNYSCKLPLDFAKLPENKKMIETIPDDVINKVFSFYRANQDNIYLQRNYIMFRVLLETGLRLSEMLHLKVYDFDFKTNTILVKKTKTNLERYVFFSNETKDLLNKYIVSARLEYNIFIDFITGNILETYSVESICTRLRKRLQIKKSINPHKWRHTFATNFNRRNGNMEVLRQILGHTSLKTTQKYLHVNVDDLRNEYFRLYN